MNSENRQSTSFDTPILLLKFVNDKQTILYDTDHHSEVNVNIHKGVSYHEEDDCSHVCFTICVEQLYEHRRGCGREERADGGGVVSYKSRF
jgi:hypothetical protein